MARERRTAGSRGSGLHRIKEECPSVCSSEVYCGAGLGLFFTCLIPTALVCWLRGMEQRGPTALLLAGDGCHPRKKGFLLGPRCQGSEPMPSERPHFGGLGWGDEGF